MNLKAISKLYPSIIRYTEDGGGFDEQGNQIVIDMDAVNSWVDPDQYKDDRLKEYPPITDYLDGVVKGDQAQIDAYIAACQAVKAKYPKV